MGSVGGPRHYSGGGTAQPYKWKCPSCQTEHLTPLEAGCPSCGAGTPEQAEAAMRAATETVPLDRLIEAVVADLDVAPEYWLGLPGLTPAARVTIAVALAHYAEHGAPPSTEELPRTLTLTWARRLMFVTTEER